jgi:hypothetical protein
MIEVEDIKASSDRLFGDWMPESCALHQSQPDVSAFAYLQNKQLALQTELQGKTLIYLDTNHWLNLRHVVLRSQQACTRYAEMFQLLESLKQKNRVLCPLSYPLFLELMRQSDEVTRLVTARLMDFFSDGVCIVDDAEIRRIELRRCVLGLLLGDKDDPRPEWVWSKCGFLFGSVVPNWGDASIAGMDSEWSTAIADIPKNDQVVLSKVTIDHNWMMRFEHVAKVLMPGRPIWPPTDLVDKTTARIEQYRRENLSFDDVLLNEKSCLYRRLSEKHLKKLAADIWERHPELHDVTKLPSNTMKDVNPHVIPSLHVAAGVNAAFAVSPRKFDLTDISDFQHAAIAVPYFDAMFCDNGMAVMLRDKPLEFSKLYDTRILSRPDEICDYLRQLLN